MILGEIGTNSARLQEVLRKTEEFYDEIIALRI